MNTPTPTDASGITWRNRAKKVAAGLALAAFALGGAAAMAAPDAPSTEEAGKKISVEIGNGGGGGFTIQGATWS